MEFIQRYTILFIALTSVNWTFVFSERIKCPEINAPNLRVKLRSKGRLANFSCKKKFELVGVKFAVCVPDGNWSQQIPSCVGTTCRKPVQVQNIIVEELYKGGVLKFTCGAGLIRSGPETLMCDGNKWSDEPPKCIEGTTLQCDFEDIGLCGWSQDFDDDFDWTWHGGETPTAQTGPGFDHTTNTSKGHYMYMESSAPQAFGQKTRLLSPPYSPASMINMCLEFFYHMYGPDGDGEVGDLDVYVKPLTQKNTTLSPSRRIFHMSGNQNDQWLPAEVQLPPMDNTFQIVFQATRLKSWSGDIAIDDVRLHSCSEETTTSSGPTESDDTDDEDNSQEPPMLKTTEIKPITTTTTKPTTGSTATTRTRLLLTTVSTPPTTASTVRTPPPTTTASTPPTTTIVTVTATEPTSIRTSASTITTTTTTPSTTSVITPRLRTIITTLRTTSTPTSTSSTPTRTTTTKPTKTSAASTTASSESTRTRTPTAASTKPTTATVKLTKPTTVTESTTTTATTVSTTTTTATNDITTPGSTAGTPSTTTSRAINVKTTSESTSNPPSPIAGQVTTGTDESIPAAVITSTSDSVDGKDWSRSETHVTSTLMPSTTDATDDTGSDNTNTDLYDYDNENPTTHNENDNSDDNDENYSETTISMSTPADYIDYDSTNNDLGQASTFNTSDGNNGSQPVASDDKDSGNDNEGSKSTQSETGKSLSKTDLNHGAVREKESQPSSTTTEVLPLIIGVAASVVVAAVVIAVLAYLWARNQRRKQEKEQEDQMNIITDLRENGCRMWQSVADDLQMGVSDVGHLAYDPEVFRKVVIGAEFCKGYATE